MSLATAFAPVFVQVALTFALLVLGGQRPRRRWCRSGAVKMRDVALGEPNWPARATQIINAYENQLELPVLFYLAHGRRVLQRAHDARRWSCCRGCSWRAGSSTR